MHYEKIVIDPDSLFHELHITGLDNNLMPVGILGGGLRGWCKLCVQNSGYPGTGVVFHSSRVSLPLSFLPTDILIPVACLPVLLILKRDGFSSGLQSSLC